MAQLQLTEPASQPRVWEIAMTYCGDSSDDLPLVRVQLSGGCKHTRVLDEEGRRLLSRGSDRWKEGNGQGEERLAADGGV